MPKPKKGKSRVPVPSQEEGGGEGLAPIPEDAAGYEGYDNYGQSGEAWQNEGTAWPGYAQGDQWGHQPETQPGAWDTGQYPQQEWPPPTTSPANAPAPSASGSAAFAAWGHNPQGQYGPPGQPPAAQHPPPAGPPPGVPPSRRQQHDPSLAASTPSWQNWGAEAMVNSRQIPPPSTHPPGPGYGQQGRVAFASYVPTVSRDESTPQGQQGIFDSIMNSRGGAPAPMQPQHRSGRGSAQNPTKQSRKSKREKRAQEQNAPNAWDGQQENAGWDHQGQENSAWEQENPRWEKEGYGWTQQEGDYGGKQEADWGGKQEADWGGKQEAAWNQWDSGEAGRDDMYGDGHMGNHDWNDATGRRNHQHQGTLSSPFFQPPNGTSPYSRTMAYARGTAQNPPDTRSPASGFSRKRSTSTNEYINLESLESYGEALKPVEGAFFGRERKARERIHWQFPHEKDERVRDALEWLYGHARSVAVFGLNKFLHTRERGALFINAAYDSPTGGGPALDWLIYDDVVETRDRLLQESVGFYDPSVQVVVFVFLPSKSGNSLAMWRRKITVPDSIRLTHLREIDLVKATLRKDYPVLVDEMRSPPYRLSSLQASGGSTRTKKKKKGFFRRLFRIFKIVW